jgi:hypothetical protein
MPYKSVLHEDKLISAVATMREALADDQRKVTNNICEMLELAESGIAYNMKEGLQKQIAFSSRINEITGAKIETLLLISRLIAQFTKYEYVKEEVTEEASGG